MFLFFNMVAACFLIGRLLSFIGKPFYKTHWKSDLLIATLLSTIATCIIYLVLSFSERMSGYD
ncbi:MAG TPA: hypothetical protein VE710_24250 [Candidatus Bathyarchaeia archaeon]|nr:hypothetical protein [Candidatus Bathyarchaeia archaeon]